MAGHKAQHSRSSPNSDGGNGNAKREKVQNNNKAIVSNISGCHQNKKEPQQLSREKKKTNRLQNYKKNKKRLKIVQQDELVQQQVSPANKQRSKNNTNVQQ